MHLARALVPTVVLLLLVGCGDKGGEDTSPAATDGGGAGDDGGTAVTDADGDGYIDAAAGGDDCDDEDPDVHPGADERCNWADDDCDGHIDEDGVDGAGFYADADGDGYGDPDTEGTNCSAEEGQVNRAGDCDDTNWAIHPYATEVCDDGLDSDCDGELDDGDCVWGVPAETAKGFLTGEVERAFAGTSVANAHDVDGDGLDEIIVGAYRTATGGGGAYIFDGVPAGTASLEDATALLDGWDYYSAGGVVAGPGDVDGDGYADVLVSASQHEVGAYGAGAVFLQSGPFSGPSSLADSDGAVFCSPLAALFVGLRLSAMGDVNSDGLADFATNNGSSIALVLGPATGRIDLDYVDLNPGEWGAYLVGSSYQSVVRPVGDIDFDGNSEIAVGDTGAVSADGVVSGAVYIVGGPFTGLVEVTSEAVGELVGSQGEEMVGSDLSAGLDVSGDGYTDLVIGAEDPDTEPYRAGRNYLVLGPLTGEHSLADAQARLDGVSRDYAWKPQSLGDLDSDGHDDFAVRARWDDTVGDLAGAVYVIHGPVTGTWDLSDVASSKLVGETHDDTFGSGGFASDFDGDGSLELVVGASGSDRAYSDGGTIYFFDAAGL